MDLNPSPGLYGSCQWLGGYTVIFPLCSSFLHHSWFNSNMAEKVAIIKILRSKHIYLCTCKNRNNQIVKVIFLKGIFQNYLKEKHSTQTCQKVCLKFGWYPDIDPRFLCIRGLFFCNEVVLPYWFETKLKKSNNQVWNETPQPRSLTLMLLMAILANTKWCKKPEKWPKPWHIGTHLRVLSKRYLMNIDMTGFECLHKF